MAVILAESGGVQKFLVSTQEIKFLGVFVAGMLFTSVFTVAPATVALGTIAAANDILTVAVIGGLGALIGDLIIFRFLKEHLTDDLIKLMRINRGKKMIRWLNLPPFRWTLAAVGAVLVASPLPDELGLTLMGLSKINSFLFGLISFSFNALGIYLVGLAARALV